MHRILLIAKRDYLASIRSKAFVFSLVIAPILFGGGFLGLALMKGKPDLKDRRVAIVDRTGMAADAILQVARQKSEKEVNDKVTGKQVAPRYLFEAAPQDSGDPNAQRLALSDRVRRGELFAFVEIGANALHPPSEETADKEKDKDKPENRVGYYSNADGIDEARSWLSSPVNEGLRRVRLARLGVDPGRFDEIFAAVPVQRMSLVTRDEHTGEIREGRKKSEFEGFIVPFTVMMLLAMITMATSGPMLPSVSEDKLQRVFEMLLGSATPFELMMGKVVAAVGRSLTSSFFYVTSGILVLEGLAVTGLAPLQILPWFLVYLVADVTMLCAFAVALGAACSSPQDAQNLGVVLLSPVLVPLFLIMPVLQQPNGAVSTAMSLFPPFTPLIMLVRQAMPGGVPAWQPWVGLVGIAGWTLAITFAAARIFRIAILMQGKAPKPAELLRWAVRG